MRAGARRGRPAQGAGRGWATIPSDELQQARAEPTMADLCDVFVAEYLPRLRPATVKQYRPQSTDQRPATASGALPAQARRRGAHHDVEDFHRIVSRAAPTMANRALAVLSRMFGAAIRRGWRADNPAKGTERNQETKRTRYLSPAEIARLTAALAALGDQQAANIFRLLLLTGARRGEVQAMRWDQIDLAAGVWTKPGSTTKQKTEHRVPLSAPALQLLAGLERPGEYVFPGRDGEGHRVEVKAQWANVCRGRRHRRRPHARSAAHLRQRARDAPACPCRSSARCWGTHSRPRRRGMPTCSTTRCGPPPSAWGPIVTGGEGADVVPMGGRA